MGLGVFLYSVLSAGAELAASSAVGEFAKGAGKASFDALKAQLAGEHKVKSLGLLEDAKQPNSPKQTPGTGSSAGAPVSSWARSAAP